MVIRHIYGVLGGIMINKIIGVILIGAAVYIWLGYGPSKKESRSSFKSMLISIVLAFVCVTLAMTGVFLFRGEMNLF